MIMMTTMMMLDKTHIFIQICQVLKTPHQITAVLQKFQCGFPLLLAAACGQGRTKAEDVRVKIWKTRFNVRRPNGLMKLGPGLEVVDFLLLYTVKTVLLAHWNTFVYTFHQKRHPRGVKSVPWYNLKYLIRLWQLIGSVGCSVYQLRIASTP